MLPQWGGIFQKFGEDLFGISSFLDENSYHPNPGFSWLDNRSCRRFFDFSNGVASSEDCPAARTARSRAAQRNPVPSVMAVDFAFHQFSAPSDSSDSASAISAVWHSKGRCAPGMQHSFG